MTNAWDGFGRLASSSIDMDGVTRTLSYQHDAAGQRTMITHPDGTFFRTLYDTLGRAYSTPGAGIDDVAWPVCRSRPPMNVAEACKAIRRN